MTSKLALRKTLADIWKGDTLSKTGALPAAEPLVHLLNRISYGVTREQLDLARNMGYEAYVEWQLNYEAIDDSELETFLTNAMPTLNFGFDDLRDREQDDLLPMPGELIVGTLLRRAFSPRQLYERMVEFWNDHFNVFLFNGPLQYLKPIEDRQVMRPHALGNFHDLLRADAASPAMLYYLDNYNNTNLGPNENYARELMELHTLGVGGGYSENDVKEVARCFTGWTIDIDVDEFFTFVPFLHDNEAKTVLGTSITSGGMADGEAVLELLANHPATGQFLATKLVRRFVDDTPPQSLVDAVAATYSSSAGDIREMMRTLLYSDEFRNSQDAKFKRPAEFTLSILRTVDPFIVERGVTLLAESLQSLDDLPFTWETPDGVPDIIDDWLNTGALLNRWNLGLGIADGSFSKALQVKIFDLLGNARTPQDIVERLADVLLHRPITVDDRQVLVDYVAQGAPVDQPLHLIHAVKRGRELIGLLMASRYFQFR